HPTRGTTLDDGLAVFPQRLQRAERPAESLSPQLAYGGRGLRPRHRFLLEHRAPAGSSDADGEVGVLGEGLGAQTAHLKQRRTSERATRTGYGRHRTHDLVHTSIHIEPDDVFD